MDLEKFKDPHLSVHDNNALLAILATHESILAKEVAIYNKKLEKLHKLIDKVAAEEKKWTMEELTAELEEINSLYQTLYCTLPGMDH